MRRRRGHPLTEQQLRVLSLMSHGYSNVEIAAQLVVSLNTVKSHSARVLRALKAVDSAHAVRIAFEDGWLRDSSVRRQRGGRMQPREGVSAHEELALVKAAAADLVRLMHTELSGDEMRVWAALDKLAPMVGAETCAGFLGVEG